MIPNIEKLKHLWRSGSSAANADSQCVRRAKNIYEIVEGWERCAAAIATIGSHPSPEEKGIPTNSWPKVKEELLKLYDSNEDLTPFRTQVDEIETLLLIANPRDARFRIASNAAPESAYETLSTVRIRTNPESYCASYNYPFEIIRFFLACKQNLEEIEPLQYSAHSKFAPKFLWMLANRETAVPILSLASFFALAPLFGQIDKTGDWGDRGNQWDLSLPDFASRWPGVSAKLAQQITGQQYAALTADQKMDFAKLLFIASVTDTTTKNALDMVKTGNQAIILYGPPGTGKTHQAQEVVKQLMEPGVSELEDCKFSNLFAKATPQPGGQARSISQPGCWELIQFHPTYSYHDFIGGIMPELTDDKLGYTRNEGIFKRFCDAAKANRPKPFVLIIDEINRADLSSVFGELMYALEYRNKPVSVPHFGPFEIPENVFLIGTMNSVDKSLVTFDLALRRRFLFFKLMPDMSVLNDWNANRLPPIYHEDLDSFIERANELNKAVVGKGQNELELPKDYGIGQAYFMKIGDFCVKERSPATQGEQCRITAFAREQLWTYHLEPLLEEYLGAEADAKRSDLLKLRDNFLKDS